MAGKKISELAAGSEFATNDLVEFVDVSDTSMSPTGTNKKATLNNLVGKLLFATPGTITAGYALIADSEGKIEGVTASQFGRLNVSAGSWTANKVLAVDAAGKILEVTSSNFVALISTAGSWTSEKVLKPDASGLLAGVSQTQFTALAVTAGSFTNSKAVVLNSSGIVSNSYFTLDTATPYVKLQTDSTHKLELFYDKAKITSANYVASVLPRKIEFTDGTYTTEYKDAGLYIHTSNGNIELDASTSPVSLTIQSGAVQCYMTRNSLQFLGGASGTLDVRLQGLPTSEPAESYRIWVDTAAGNVLKIKLP